MQMVMKVGVIGVSFGTSRSLFESLSKGVYETYNLKYKNTSVYWKNVNRQHGH